MSQAFDLTRIQGIADGDASFVEQIIQTFLEHIPAQLTALMEAYQAGRWEDMGRAAHTLKSSIDLFGIQSLHDPIRWLEAEGKMGQPNANYHEAIAGVQKTLYAVMDQLAAGKR